MVEGRNQSDFGRKQHAVAENVAAHVTDTSHCEALGLDIDIDFAEMAFDRLPAAAGRNAHLLVVVSGRSARGKGVAEPEIAAFRDGVCRIGKACGALVGGNHEVGVVGVAPENLFGRQHGVAHQIIGHIEQAGDEYLVARRALGQKRVAVWVGWHEARHEPALGAHRHDHRVLDHLRLDQPQNFGSKIFGAIRPAQPAAGNRPAAHVDTFEARGIDENLTPGSWLGYPFEPRGVELDGERRARLAVDALVEICPDAGFDQVEQPPDDPVLVDRSYGFEPGDNFGAQRFGCRLAVCVEMGIVQGVEQFDKRAGGGRVGRKCRPDVSL